MISYAICGFLLTATDIPTTLAPILSRLPNWFMQEVKKQLSTNLNALVKLPTEIGPLQDMMVGWIQAACNYFKANPEVVNK